MNRKPRPHSVQSLGFYGEAHGGGLFDIGVLQLMPGVHLYHDEQIQEIVLEERRQFLPYMLSVLAVLGHPQGGNIDG